jgi:hypothetical protein
VLGHSFLSQTFRFAPFIARADARGEGERDARTAPELGHICASRKRLIAKTLCDMTGQILEILGNSTMSSNRQPRMQHYHFAHYALPEIIFNNLEHVVTTFSNPNANALLAELWPESRLAARLSAGRHHLSICVSPADEPHRSLLHCACVLVALLKATFSVFHARTGLQ